jgi:hypothetical protein
MQAIKLKVTTNNPNAAQIAAISEAQSVIDKQDKIVERWQKRLDKEEAAWDENRGVASPVPTTKPIDVDSAKALLKEAGGDKEKARSLAKERGFHF